jgi:hypothetical protein
VLRELLLRYVAWDTLRNVVVSGRLASARAIYYEKRALTSELLESYDLPPEWTLNLIPLGREKLLAALGGLGSPSGTVYALSGIARVLEDFGSA